MTQFLTITETVSVGPERAYEAFLTPEDLLQWHHAGGGWITPHAETDPVVGGRFNIGFGDPEGQHSFDFTGMYTSLNRPGHIAYTIDDGRLVEIDFTEVDNGTLVTWRFEPESENPHELQQAGWQEQLTNLKAYLG